MPACPICTWCVIHTDVVSNTQTKYRRRHSSSMEDIAKFLCTLTQKNLKKVNHFGRTNKKFRYLIVIHTSTVYRTPKKKVQVAGVGQEHEGRENKKNNQRET